MENNYCTLNGSKLVWKIYKIEKDKVYLEMNNKKMITNIDNISIINKYVPESTVSITFDVNHNLDIPNEIMLRHKTKEEAMYELEKFIDKAILNNLPRVKIIHGRSGGILRKAVHEYLENAPYVSSYSLGLYHEGGLGVTIAYLKNN